MKVFGYINSGTNLRLVIVIISLIGSMILIYIFLSSFNISVRN
jgi:hypothetical protein